MGFWCSTRVGARTLEVKVHFRKPADSACLDVTEERVMYQHGLLHLLTSYFTNSPLQNCSCNTQPEVTSVFNIFPICNLPLVPSWMLAVVIGLVGGSRLHQLGPSVWGSLTYSVTFFMYAAMITSGLFVHCLYLVECGASPPSKGYFTAALIDASLTSCIATSFFFNGLVDLKIIPERNIFTLLLMVFSYAGIFYAYFSGFISTMTFYMASVLIGCSLYLLCQLILLFRSTVHAVLLLMAAATVGGASFILFSQYSCLLCTTFGAWSIEGVWYYGSDVAMYCLLLYAMTTRQQYSQQQSQLKCTHNSIPAKTDKQ